MAGRGAAPKAATARRNHIAPARGDWQATPETGWQHGRIPPLPDGLMPATVSAWSTWMQSWVAAHWTESDLPGLRQLVRLYDQVERGEFVRMTELRLLMDTYGITPKGQQDRRWERPKAEAETPRSRITASGESPYAHLRVAK